ncbi:hypothetical protein G6F62_014142 [Rhizopus arrhizus]|nr:hypothetical protein G6F62_014142 [Rhizopus arrhizus]
MPSGQVFGELAGGDAGGRTADHRVGFGHGVQFRKQRALDLDLFRRVLLYVAGALDRVGQAAGHVHPLHDAVGVFQQALGFQFAQLLQDQRMRFGQHGRIDVVQAHVPALAGEHDGPALADQARSDDGGARRRRAGTHQ